MSLQSRSSGASRLHPATKPLWLPPVAGVVVLFVLFLAAMGVRQSPIAETARPLMIALSAIAGFVIALYGGWMAAQLRVRGWASAIAGAVMIFLGVYTVLHVLR